jgi:monoamine oxidase
MRRIAEWLSLLSSAEEGSRSSGIPAPELLERELDRRSFLQAAGLAGVGLAAAPLLPRTPRARPLAKRSTPKVLGSPRIVVVGAGLAGMTTAYRIQQAGYSPVVYEADDRVGGRTQTIRGFFDHGQTIENCGEYINSNHTSMLGIVSELGLEVDNLWSYYPRGVHTRYWAKGGRYPRAQQIADFHEVYPALHAALKAAPWPTTWDNHTREAVKLDRMTLSEWLDRNVPGGLSSRFATFVAVAYADEYGLDGDQQSALNLVYEMGFSGYNSYRLWGNQDWKWRVRGGNDLVTNTIAGALPSGCVSLQSPLWAIRLNGDGTYTLTFDQGGVATDVVADRVVLTLPFATLRNVDYSQAGFDPLKAKAIETMGMGTNAKLHMQFDSRPWQKAGFDGDSQTDLAFQETNIVYPVSGYAGGIIQVYTGGATGASYNVKSDDGPAPRAIVANTLSQLETIMPGAKAAWNGKAYIHVPTKDRWLLGSYSCPKPGEYTSIYGSEKLPSGAVHFAGEHTSINFPGYMEGAVRSGERAAQEVIAALGGPV